MGSNTHANKDLHKIKEFNKNTYWPGASAEEQSSQQVNIQASGKQALEKFLNDVPIQE